MEITLATERLFLLEDRLTADDAEQRATERRAQAFGSGIGSLLQRPKVEEISLIARQRRLEPFWHVIAHASYQYERRRDYTVPGSAPEVRAVTIHDTRYELDQAVGAERAFRMTALEHCRDEFRNEVYTDGLTGAPVADGPALIAGVRREVEDPVTLSADGTAVLPPEHRSSFVVRKSLAEVMKPVHADRILEESVALETSDLYYRPVMAFEFVWQGKDRTGVIEFDLVTGQMRQGKPLIGQLRGIVSRDLLFDVGADTVGLFVPGGSIAVKLAKAAIDNRS
ncbi:MAG TPA: hypothetical protein VEX62_02575 [Candidatus Limnocylindrales bacterium]|nr:hypothetical protein [Candidatus Limnocylindrales bacterium]